MMMTDHADDDDVCMYDLSALLIMWRQRSSTACVSTVQYMMIMSVSHYDGDESHTCDYIIMMMFIMMTMIMMTSICDDGDDDDDDNYDDDHCNY